MMYRTQTEREISEDDRNYFSNDEKVFTESEAKELLTGFDFRPVAEKYPKAFALFEKWLAKRNDCDSNSMDGVDISDGEFVIDNGGYECVPIIFNPLELDFFFDSENIIGSVEFDTEAFGYQIPTHNIICFGTEISKYFYNRSEALTALWMKEFEILESKLSA